MKTIPLTKGKVALVDDRDYEWLSQWKWQAVELKRKTTRSTWYARRGQKRLLLPRVIYMHREIVIHCGHPHESEYDHKDGDGLNNQRSNLRECSQSQNNGNRVKEGNCTSRYKGVSWSKCRGKWVAVLRLNKKAYGAKRFSDEEAAARHYDSLARVHFGEFSKLNFP